MALTHFFKPRAMLNSLVRELTSEGRPPGIKNGFRHGGPDQSGGAHGAYRDVIKLAHDAGAELVVKVVPAIRNLSVYRFGAALLARPLRDGQGLFSAPVDSLSLNLFARGQGSEVFEAQVNANALEWLANTWCSGLDINYDVEEPISPSVAGKVRAVLDLAVRQGAAVEYAKGVAGKAECIAFAFQFPALDWHPAQRLFVTVAQVWAFLLAPRFGVLLADGVNRARVKAKLLAAAAGELVQVKAGMPAPAKAQGILLSVIAEVPDEVAGPALLVQQAGQRLHPVAIDQNHAGYINGGSPAASRHERCAFAFYLPGLKSGASREFG